MCVNNKQTEPHLMRFELQINSGAKPQSRESRVEVIPIKSLGLKCLCHVESSSTCQDPSVITSQYLATGCVKIDHVTAIHNNVVNSLS